MEGETLDARAHVAAVRELAERIGGFGWSRDVMADLNLLAALDTLVPEWTGHQRLDEVHDSIVDDVFVALVNEGFSLAEEPGRWDAVLDEVNDALDRRHR